MKKFTFNTWCSFRPEIGDYLGRVDVALCVNRFNRILFFLIGDEGSDGYRYGERTKRHYSFNDR